MVSVYRSVNCHHHIVIVHLLQESGDPRTCHEARPTRHALAHVAKSGAVRLRHLRHPQLRQNTPALGVVSDRVRLDLANVLAQEGALDEQHVGLLVLEDELLPHHVDQDLPDQLPHVHPAYHLLKGLSARIQASLINCQVPFCSDKIQFSLE